MVWMSVRCDRNPLAFTVATVMAEDGVAVSGRGQHGGLRSRASGGLCAGGGGAGDLRGAGGVCDGLSMGRAVDFALCMEFLAEET